MSKPRVGWLSATPDPELVEALGDRCEVVPVEATASAVTAAELDAWCVRVPGLTPPVLLTVRDASIPGLFLVDPEERRSWNRVIRKGVHDVCWLPAEPEEVRARMLGQLARLGAWTTVSSALCRELAHDMRGPLQALNFTVAALQQDGALDAAYQEDVDALLEATDVTDLMLDGIANLGRHARPVPAGTPALDLTEVVRKVTERRAFSGKVMLDGGEPLRVCMRADVLESAVEDVVRVAWIRAADGRRVRVQCFRFGNDAVVSTQSKAYDALLAHLPALLWRERPILLRRERVPMPLAGLAFAREAAQAAGGDLTVRREGQELHIEMRVPLA